MNISLNAPNKRRHGLFALAILLLLLAVPAFIVGWNNTPLRTLSMMLLVFSVYCVRLSRSDSATIANRQTGQYLGTRPSQAIWIASITLLLVLGMSSVFLYRSAVQGYHEGWPVYLFAGVAMACALVWGYLVSLLV